MDKPSPIGFFMEHVDGCSTCLNGDYCDSARNLWRRAMEIAAEHITPIPVETKNKA